MNIEELKEHTSRNGLVHIMFVEKHCLSKQVVKDSFHRMGSAHAIAHRTFKKEKITLGLEDK